MEHCQWSINVNYNVRNEIIYNIEVLKSILPFTECITKIDGTTINDAEDLDLVM